uniref:Uncharacterized protein n=1 Tax=Pithovirus LCPAC103 TaxID=2506588 RepID=A0A481Z399_9VIRU|nr:MAG: hypothetical protein LCPAC103_00340 [Pithovirus LCPAC103]
MEKSSASLTTASILERLTIDQVAELKTALWPQLYIVVTEGWYGSEGGFEPKVFGAKEDADSYAQEIGSSGNLDTRIFVRQLS